MTYNTKLIFILIIAAPITCKPYHYAKNAADSSSSSSSESKSTSETKSFINDQPRGATVRINESDDNTACYVQGNKNSSIQFYEKLKNKINQLQKSINANQNENDNFIIKGYKEDINTIKTEIRKFKKKNKKYLKNTYIYSDTDSSSDSTSESSDENSSQEKTKEVYQTYSYSRTCFQLPQRYVYRSQNGNSHESSFYWTQGANSHRAYYSSHSNQYTNRHNNYHHSGSRRYRENNLDDFGNNDRQSYNTHNFYENLGRWNQDEHFRRNWAQQHQNGHHSSDDFTQQAQAGFQQFQTGNLQNDNYDQVQQHSRQHNLDYTRQTQQISPYNEEGLVQQTQDINQNEKPQKQELNFNHPYNTDYTQLTSSQQNQWHRNGLSQQTQTDYSMFQDKNSNYGQNEDQRQFSNERRPFQLQQNKITNTEDLTQQVQDGLQQFQFDNLNQQSQQHVNQQHVNQQHVDQQHVNSLTPKTKDEITETNYSQFQTENEAQNVHNGKENQQQNEPPISEDLKQQVTDEFSQSQTDNLEKGTWGQQNQETQAFQQNQLVNQQKVNTFTNTDGVTQQTYNEFPHAGNLEQKPWYQQSQETQKENYDQLQSFNNEDQQQNKFIREDLTQQTQDGFSQSQIDDLQKNQENQGKQDFQLQVGNQQQTLDNKELYQQQQNKFTNTEDSAQQTQNEFSQIPTTGLQIENWNKQNQEILNQDYQQLQQQNINNAERYQQQNKFTGTDLTQQTQDFQSQQDVLQKEPWDRQNQETQGVRQSNNQWQMAYNQKPYHSENNLANTEDITQQTYDHWSETQADNLQNENFDQQNQYTQKENYNVQSVNNKEMYQQQQSKFNRDDLTQQIQNGENQEIGDVGQIRISNQQQITNDGKPYRRKDQDKFSSREELTQQTQEIQTGNLQRENFDKENQETLSADHQQLQYLNNNQHQQQQNKLTRENLTQQTQDKFPQSHVDNLQKDTNHEQFQILNQQQTASDRNKYQQQNFLTREDLTQQTQDGFSQSFTGNLQNDTWDHQNQRQGRQKEDYEELQTLNQQQTVNRDMYQQQNEFKREDLAQEPQDEFSKSYVDNVQKGTWDQQNQASQEDKQIQDFNHQTDNSRTHYQQQHDKLTNADDFTQQTQNEFSPVQINNLQEIQDQQNQETQKDNYEQFQVGNQQQIQEIHNSGTAELTQQTQDEFLPSVLPISQQPENINNDQLQVNIQRGQTQPNNFAQFSDDTQQTENKNTPFIDKNQNEQITTGYVNTYHGGRRQQVIHQEMNPTQNNNQQDLIQQNQDTVTSRAYGQSQFNHNYEDQGNYGHTYVPSNPDNEYIQQIKQHRPNNHLYQNSYAPREQPNHGTLDNNQNTQPFNRNKYDSVFAGGVHYGSPRYVDEEIFNENTGELNANADEIPQVAHVVQDVSNQNYQQKSATKLPQNPNVQVETVTKTNNEEEITPEPGFWTRVGGKIGKTFQSAKEKIRSWTGKNSK